LSQKVNFNHFYSSTQNILFDTLAQSRGTSDVTGTKSSQKQ